MNRARCRSLVLAAWLCGAAPVVAEGPGGLWLNPVPGLDTVARPDPVPAGRVELDLLRFFGGAALEWGNNRFAVPLKTETWRLDSRRSLLVNALAIEWQHSLNAANLLTLNARYGDSYSDQELPGPFDRLRAGSTTGSAQAASGTTATLSWSTLFGGESRLSGRLYVGDEEAKLAANGDRRYFGMQLEGRYGLWRDHAPFASLLWQRSNHEAPDNTGLAGASLRRENFSRFAAGWNWQVSRGWDVRAEANYRLADDSAEAGEFDRTQLYFSTRYGFR